MPSYFAFGLTIESEIDLPELQPRPDLRSGSADVVIRNGRVDDRPATTGEVGGWFRTSAHEACLVWREVGALRIRDGREIVVDAQPDADPGLLRLGLLGDAVVLLLQQRGFYPLHGSVIKFERGSGAAIFCGASGWGKSTMAAMLHERGHRLVSDDIAAIRIDDAGCRVYPGYPHMKLWPESAQCIGADVDKLPRLHRGEQKRSRRLEGEFPTEPLGVLAIYVLGEGHQESIGPVTGHAAFAELARHTSCPQLQLPAIGPAKQLAMISRLLRSVPLFTLTRRRRLELLGDVCDRVESHLATLTLSSD